MKRLLLFLLFPLVLLADSVQPNFFTLTPLTSGTIPTSAKGWTAVVLSGTSTIGGVSYVAGQALFDKNTPLTQIVITTGTGSNVYYRYNQ